MRRGRLSPEEKAVLQALKNHPYGWRFKARDLAEEVSEILGKPISSKSIAKILRKIRKVRRIKTNPPPALYESRVGCCRYSRFSRYVNPRYCVACGRFWR